MGERADHPARAGHRPPAIFWAPQEIAIDAFHHVVFAAATGIAYQLLSNGRGAHNGASKAS
jgi:hypothetical protein